MLHVLMCDIRFFEIITNFNCTCSHQNVYGQKGEFSRKSVG